MKKNVWVWETHRATGKFMLSTSIEGAEQVPKEFADRVVGLARVGWQFTKFRVFPEWKPRSGCHSGPVRPSAANGPERSEGAQGKLREES
jgi:hypothetical protein